MFVVLLRLTKMNVYVDVRVKLLANSSTDHIIALKIASIELKFSIFSGYAIHKRQNYWETERLSSNRHLSSDIIELLLLPNNWRKNNIAQSPQTYIQTAKSVENRFCQILLQILLRKESSLRRIQI